MLVQTKDEGAVTVVEIGEHRVDAAIAPELKDYIADLVQQGKGKILLDLKAVEFMDSSGLGALVAGLKSVGGKGELAIAGIEGQVMELFKLTRMDRVFTLYESADAGISAMA
jgi:anti-sigma B factor antagonist